MEIFDGATWQLLALCVVFALTAGVVSFYQNEVRPRSRSRGCWRELRDGTGTAAVAGLMGMFLSLLWLGMDYPADGLLLAANIGIGYIGERLSMRLYRVMPRLIVKLLRDYVDEQGEVRPWEIEDDGDSTARRQRNNGPKD